MARVLPFPLRSLGFAPEHLFGEGRFLGEYYCLWAAELLGYSNDDVIEQLGVATVFARAHAVLADSLVDRIDRGDPRVPHLAALFLGKALSIYQSIVPDISEFMSTFDRCVLQAATTDTHERTTHWGRLSEFAPEDMVVLGRKTSLCFLPAAVMCLLVGKPGLIPLFNRLIEKRNVAVQLRDDLADLHEDLAVRNFTLPLSLAFRILGVPDEDRPEKLADPKWLTVVPSSLLKAGGLDIVCHLSLRYIELAREALLALPGPADSALHGYFLSMRDWTVDFIDIVRTFRDERLIQQPSLDRFTILDGDWPTIAVRLPARCLAVPDLSDSVCEEIHQLFQLLHPRPWLT